MDSGFFMSVAQDLGAVLDFAEQPLSRLDVFTDHIPQEWISTAATLAEKATVRRRRLPSDMVLWLVVGMALFRGEPIVECAFHAIRPPSPPRCQDSCRLSGFS
ncbi:transposase [Pseudomonas syringae pv. actinidiae ICMP 9853]|uniref:IS4 transposase n=1 Tax=Pseudomonas syringae pv. actinidiae TaxID=103796 RepID=A0A2V0Q8K1_PSESF|nr:transposase [Pseudomonas syringae pv. actinidiae ICMP 9853]EPM83024.1 transposase-like protein [Pseudomonas syringae pv. actinidiae ICMP 19068]GBH09051.1 IS4 transposase [Pseudomonas syringae pv. actinidiae]